MWQGILLRVIYKTIATIEGAKLEGEIHYWLFNTDDGSVLNEDIGGGLWDQKAMVEVVEVKYHLQSGLKNFRMRNKVFKGPNQGFCVEKHITVQIVSSVISSYIFCI